MDPFRHIVRTLAAILMLALVLTQARAQCAPSWLGSPEQGLIGTYYNDSSGQTRPYIYAMTTWDPDGPGPQAPLVVVGGKFQAVGNVFSRNIAAWDGTTWISLGGGTDGTDPNTSVTGLGVFNGELIASGSFTSIGGTAANRIARWNGVAWQPMGTGLNDIGYTMTVYQDELIVGGRFTTAGGQSVGRIAQWNGAAWQPLGAGIGTTGSNGDEVDTLAIFNDELIAAGAFVRAGGQPVGYIARWNGSIWQPLGSGTDSWVSALTVYGTDLIAGGGFSNAGGQPAARIARWNGSSWQALGTGVTGPSSPAVRALAVYNNEVIASGNGITNAGGVSVNQIARWNGASWQALDGGLTTVSSGSGVIVNGLVIHNGRLIAAGYFEQAGSNPVLGVAAWNGATWGAVSSGLNGSVRTVGVHDGALVCGGTFTTAGNQQVGGVVKWNGASWQSLGSGVNGTVLAVTTYNGDLVIGGDFTVADGQPAAHIARWDGAAWHPLGAGANGVVYALTTYAGELIAAGSFTSAGGVSANNIARWNGQGWLSLGAGLGGSVSNPFPRVLALSEYGGALIVGGSFATAGSQNASDLARWDGVSWQAFQGVPNNSVNAICVFNDRLIVAGMFAAVGTLAAAHIAAWDGSSWSTLGSGVGTGGSWVDSLLVYDAGLIVGGSFPTAGGQAASRVARWNGATWSALGPGLSATYATSTASCLCTFNGELVAGGNFINAGVQISSGWARWSSGQPWIIAQPQDTTLGCQGSTILSAPVAHGYQVSYQWRRDGLPLTDGVSNNGTSYQGVHSSDLLIGGARAGDSGVFDCVISNSCTSINSLEATVLITPCCGSADFNCDGDTGTDQDIDAFFACLSGLCPALPCLNSADFNADGDVGTDQDIESFFRVLGGGPC